MEKFPSHMLEFHCVWCGQISYLCVTTRAFDVSLVINHSYRLRQLRKTIEA